MKSVFSLGLLGLFDQLGDRVAVDRQPVDQCVSDHQIRQVDGVPLGVGETDVTADRFAEADTVERRVGQRDVFEPHAVQPTVRNVFGSGMHDACHGAPR